MRLRDLEHEGDEITHEIIRRLNTVFVTPLDHEDIHRLTSTLDDVVDHIEAAADLFEFANGWTDAPNSIATVVSTRVLRPFHAVLMAGLLNLIGALSGTAVAKTIASGIVDADFVTLTSIGAAVLAATIWALGAQYFGLPSSESHALDAGLLGAGFAAGGWTRSSGAGRASR